MVETLRWTGCLIAAADRRFPRWDVDEALPGPRSLLNDAGRKYMIANDHDRQVMYHHRDLLESPAHRAPFQARYGYP